MMQEASFKPVSSRDRWIIISCLFCLTAIAWLYLAILAVGMDDMTGDMASTPPIEGSFTSPGLMPWSAVEFGLMFLMWSVMMVGMMIPSAAPMILMFAKINRNQHGGRHLYITTGMFIGGYIVIWSVFSLVVTVLQLVLKDMGLISSMMTSSSIVLSSLLLVVAGLYQLTPLKNACLRHCQTPLGFLMNRWRDGARGAFHMGLSHGAYCLGCCWGIMALLFIGGVMNLIWIAVLAIFVFLEKIMPSGKWGTRISGIMLLAWGCMGFYFGNLGIF